MAPASHRPSRLLALSLSVLLAVPALVAWHWASQGWRDRHVNYPRRPSGYRQIVGTFGRPCSRATHAISMRWRAANNGVLYRFRFHKKLGGKATAMVPPKGGLSTNLDNDVKGHVINRHLSRFVKSGIWGYVCRYIRGTTKWSTHAWGIAVDVSASFEHYPGHYHSHVNWRHARIWKRHRWYWGKAFGDAMHFQYADSY